MIKLITKIITFIGGLYFFLEFILPKKFSIFKEEIFFGKYHDQISLSLVLISCVAVGLGIINLLNIHGRIIISKRSGFYSSLILIISFFFSLYIQTVSWINKETLLNSWKEIDAIVYYVSNTKDLDFIKLEKNLEIILDKKIIPTGVEREEYLSTIESLKLLLLEKDNFKEKFNLKLTDYKSKSIKSYEESLNSEYIRKSEKIIINGLFFPLGASMFSLLAFYIAYAAYRSFRIRSIESAFMMLAALLIILGQIPQGSLYISESLPEFRLWIMENLSTPALRAISFGSAIAGLSLSLRMWFSMEKSNFN